MGSGITPIVMPKWGLAMLEGELTSWNIEEGVEIASGAEIADIETTKIANAFESPTAGLVRRLVATAGETLPVGALLAVVADKSIDDAAIDAFIAEFQANFVPPEEGADDGPTPQTVDVKGRTLSYISAGPEGGDTVLLIHGFGADVNGWMFNQSALAEGRRVIALDLPGHGRSGKDVGAGDISVFAEAIESFIAELGLKKVHLVGHSLGGAAALKSAGAPEIASLTLIAPAGLGDDINTQFLEGFLAAKRRKDLQPVLEQLVADPSLISRDMMDDVLKFKRLDGVVSALSKIIAANFPGGAQAASLRNDLAKLSIPVTVIWGAHDKIIPSSHASDLPDGVKVQIVEDAGHIPQMEASGAVNDLILATIEGA